MYEKYVMVIKLYNNNNNNNNNNSTKNAYLLNFIIN